MRCSDSKRLKDLQTLCKSPVKAEFDSVLGKECGKVAKERDIEAEATFLPNCYECLMRKGVPFTCKFGEDLRNTPSSRFHIGCYAFPGHQEGEHFYISIGANQEMLLAVYSDETVFDADEYQKLASIAEIQNETVPLGCWKVELKALKAIVLLEMSLFPCPAGCLSPDLIFETKELINTLFQEKESQFRPERKAVESFIEEMQFRDVRMKQNHKVRRYRLRVYYGEKENDCAPLKSVELGIDAESGIIKYEIIFPEFRAYDCQHEMLVAQLNPLLLVGYCNFNHKSRRIELIFEVLTTEENLIYSLLTYYLKIIVYTYVLIESDVRNLLCDARNLCERNLEIQEIAVFEEMPFVQSSRFPSSLGFPSLDLKPRPISEMRRIYVSYSFPHLQENTDNTFNIDSLRHSYPNLCLLKATDLPPHIDQNCFNWHSVSLLSSSTLLIQHKSKKICILHKTPKVNKWFLYLLKWHIDDLSGCEMYENKIIGWTEIGDNVYDDYQFLKVWDQFLVEESPDIMCTKELPLPSLMELFRNVSDLHDKGLFHWFISPMTIRQDSTSQKMYLVFPCLRRMHFQLVYSLIPSRYRDYMALEIRDAGNIKVENPFAQDVFSACLLVNRGYIEYHKEELNGSNEGKDFKNLIRSGLSPCADCRPRLQNVIRGIEAWLNRENLIQGSEISKNTIPV